ncbi:lasso peptide biosynthesis PqqD family chaperone [Clostridium drakei]|uniref:PqqD family protein n=1 Tax=Clostridium drakei TaxID=332101 RepID=A0A2U8DUE2_9CLOT|nr:lasso peptide biosynthesis PqqD family chaperone [Clostridium drakei]AWI06377.1 PqqD family protein [Clostridium drakei]
MVKNIISIDDVITQKLGLDSTYMDDEIVMMDISKGKYYGFNSVGSRVWEIIERPISIKEVVSILIKEFDVDAKTCEDTVLTFLNGLYNESLITIN